MDLVPVSGSGSTGSRALRLLVALRAGYNPPRYDLVMTRRQAFSLSLVPWLQPRKAKAQMPGLSKLPFNEEIVRGDVTLQLFKIDGRLNVAASCEDRSVSRAMVTAFYLMERPALSRMPGDHTPTWTAESSKRTILRAQVRVIPCIGIGGGMCMADPFDFPVEQFAFLRVETLRSVAEYEFKS